MGYAARPTTLFRLAVITIGAPDDPICPVAPSGRRDQDAPPAAQRGGEVIRCAGGLDLQAAGGPSPASLPRTARTACHSPWAIALIKAQQKDDISQAETVSRRTMTRAVRVRRRRRVGAFDREEGALTNRTRLEVRLPWPRLRHLRRKMAKLACRGGISACQTMSKARWRHAVYDHAAMRKRKALETWTRTLRSIVKHGARKVAAVRFRG